MKRLLFSKPVWRLMLPEKGVPCFPVLGDNQGDVKLAQNPMTNSNSTQIYIYVIIRIKNSSITAIP